MKENTRILDLDFEGTNSISMLLSTYPGFEIIGNHSTETARKLLTFDGLIDYLHKDCSFDFVFINCFSGETQERLSSREMIHIIKSKISVSSKIVYLSSVKESKEAAFYFGAYTFINKDNKNVRKQILDFIFGKIERETKKYPLRRKGWKRIRIQKDGLYDIPAYYYLNGKYLYIKQKECWGITPKKWLGLFSKK